MLTYKAQISGALSFCPDICAFSALLIHYHCKKKGGK